MTLLSMMMLPYLAKNLRALDPARDYISLLGDDKSITGGNVYPTGAATGHNSA